MKANIKLENQDVFSNINLKSPFYDTSKDDLIDKIEGHILVFGEIIYFDSFVK